MGMFQEYQLDMGSVVVDNVRAREAYGKVVDFLEKIKENSKHDCQVWAESNRDQIEKLNVELNSLKPFIENCNDTWELLTASTILVSPYNIGYWSREISVSNSRKEALEGLEQAKKEATVEFYKKDYNTDISAYLQVYKGKLAIASSALYPFPVSREEAGEIYEIEQDTAEVFTYLTEDSADKRLSRKLSRIFSDIEKTKKSLAKDVIVSKVFTESGCNTVKPRTFIPESRASSTEVWLAVVITIVVVGFLLLVI